MPCRSYRHRPEPSIHNWWNSPLVVAGRQKVNFVVHTASTCWEAQPCSRGASTPFQTDSEETHPAWSSHSQPSSPIFPSRRTSSADSHSSAKALGHALYPVCSQGRYEARCRSKARKKADRNFSEPEERSLWGERQFSHKPTAKSINFRHHSRKLASHLFLATASSTSSRQEMLAFAAWVSVG